MGAVKEMLMDCLENGYVPAEARSVEKWRSRLAKGDRCILDGMPVQHEIRSRFGEMVPVDVLPIPVAVRVGRILPDTHDELGWMIECN